MSTVSNDTKKAPKKRGRPTTYSAPGQYFYKRPKKDTPADSFRCDRCEYTGKEGLWHNLRCHPTRAIECPMGCGRLLPYNEPIPGGARDGTIQSQQKAIRRLHCMTCNGVKLMTLNQASFVDGPTIKDKEWEALKTQHAGDLKGMQAAV